MVIIYTPDLGVYIQSFNTHMIVFIKITFLFTAGEIQINRGLLFSQSHSYTLEITITDSYNNQDGPNFFLLTIQSKPFVLFCLF